MICNHPRLPDRAKVYASEHDIRLFHVIDRAIKHFLEAGFPHNLAEQNGAEGLHQAS